MGNIVATLYACRIQGVVGSIQIQSHLPLLQQRHRKLPFVFPQSKLLTNALRPFFTYSLTPMSAFPSQTYIPLSNYIPYANGTRLDCAEYVQAPLSTNYTVNTTSLACEDAATQYNISLSDFISWNPSLNGITPCVMTNRTQYCTQLYNVVAPNITSTCTQYETAPPGYDCLS